MVVYYNLIELCAVNLSISLSLPPSVSLSYFPIEFAILFVSIMHVYTHIYYLCIYDLYSHLEIAKL